MNCQIGEQWWLANCKMRLCLQIENNLLSLQRRLGRKYQTGLHHRMSHIREIKNHDIVMSAQEMQQRAMKYIADQSMNSIDYQWEIQHHRQMHEAYEKNL